MSARIAPSLAAMPRHCDTNSRERRPPPRQRSGVVADKRCSRSDALDAPAQRLARYPPERDPANRRHRCTAAGSETSPLDHEFVSALPTASRAPCSSEFASGRRHLHGLRRRGVAQPDVRRAHAGAPSPLHERRRKDAARQYPQRRDAPPPQYLLILMTRAPCDSSRQSSPSSAPDTSSTTLSFQAASRGLRQPDLCTCLGLHWTPRAVALPAMGTRTQRPL